MSAMVFLNVAAAAIAILAIILLTARRVHSPGDPWLVASLGAGAALVLSFGVLRQGEGALPDAILAISAAIFLLPGPLQTLYLVRLTRPGPLPLWAYSLLLPFVTGLIFYSAIAAGFLGQVRFVAVDGFVGIVAARPNAWGLVAMTITFLQLAYPIVGLRSLDTARTRLAALWSSYTDVNVTWLRQWLWASIALIGLGLGMSVFVMAGGALSIPFLANTVQCAIVAQVIWFVYFGLRQTSLFLVDGVATPFDQVGDKTASEISTLLESAMGDDLLYCRPRLRLIDLADTIGKPAEDVSLAIRATFGLSFYDYVNSWRVRHVKDVLSQKAGQKINLLKLAYDAGFNSKSSFNSIFKQLAGMSPSEFHRRIGS